MASDFKALATAIADGVGGIDNVTGVVHCATRLRFRVKDRSLVDDDTIKTLTGVITTVDSGGQYQVVIGNNVPKVYAELPSAMTADRAASAEEESTDSNLFGRLVDVVSAIFAPMLGTMAAVGILKGLLALCVSFHWLQATSTTYHILYSAGDGFFMILPVILAVTSARKFGANVFTAMALAGALIYTQLNSFSLVLNGEAIKAGLKAFADKGGEVDFFGIPVIMQNYTSTVLPIILAVWIQSIIEKRLNNWIHESVRNFVVPLIELAILVPATLATLGPFGVYVGNVLADLLQGAYEFSPILAGILIAALWQIMVIFGVHWGIVPVFINNIAVNGFDPLKAACFPAVFSQAGAAFGLFLRLKDRQQKALAGSAALAGIFGITEPAVYGVTLPRKKVFGMAVVSAGVGGAVVGWAQALVYGTGAPGLLTLPIGIDPSGQAHTIGWLIAGSAVSFILAAVLSYLFGLSDKDKAQAQAAHSQSAASDAHVDVTAAQGEVVAPVAGNVIDLEAVNDPVFSSKSMGDGFAILPTDGRVIAPVSGTLKVVMKTGHAYGITTDDGVDVLVHIGIDTVRLGGEGFAARVTRGERVQAGDILAEVDLASMQAKGVDTTTVVVVTRPKGQTVTRKVAGSVAAGEPVVSIDASVPQDAH